MLKRKYQKDNTYKKNPSKMGAETSFHKSRPEFNQIKTQTQGEFII